MIDNTKSEREIIFSPHCHDDLGMAVANSLAAIKAGAGRVEGTVNGIGERAGNAALEEIAVALHIRKDFYQAQSPLKLSETAATAELISQFSGIAIPKIKQLLVLMLLHTNQEFIKMVSLKMLKLMKLLHQNLSE